MIWWIVFGVLFLIIMAVRFKPGGKYREMAKGHDRCSSCRASLKWSGGHYATECPKCGTVQAREVGGG
jgi:hypothetical protein